MEGAGNEVTVFINCRITDGDGTVMGGVGLGFRVDSLQALLQGDEKDFGGQQSVRELCLCKA